MLPYGGKSILQDAASQGVSLAAELLHQAVTEDCADQALHALELGCGCGIVSIMCALLRPSWMISAVEIQASLAALARRNATRCGLKLDIRQADLRETQGEFDLVYANPPWRRLNSGIMSPSEARNISRFEVQCTMEDILQTIHRVMKPRAKAFLIYPLERLEELQQKAHNTLLDIIKHRIHGGNKACFVATLTHRDII